MEISQNIEFDMNDVNAEDYRRVLFWYHRKKNIGIALICLLSIPILIFFLAFGKGTNPFDAESRDLLLIIFTLVLFGSLPLSLVLSLLSIWKQAKKLAIITEDATLSFNENGLKTKSDSTSFETTWERFAKICETKTDFVFFPQENIFYPIPKRFFKNKSQIDDFKKLVSQKLGVKARLLN